jgi:hypothetical protein
MDLRVRNIVLSARIIESFEEISLYFIETGSGN